MFDSLKKLLGGGLQLKNPEGLSGGFLKLLKADLEPLGSFGLLDQAMVYVVDGEGEEVLLKVRGDAKIKDAMIMMTGPQVFHQKRKAVEQLPRRVLFANLEVGTGKVLHRLAQLYHAIVTSSPGNSLHVEHLPADLAWLECLIREGSGSMVDVTPVFAEDVKWSVADFMTILAAGGHGSESLAQHVFGRKASRYGAREEFFKTIDGLSAYLGEQPGMAVAILEAANAEGKIELIDRLRRYCVPIGQELVQALCRVATGTAKTVRESAQAALRGENVDQAELISEVKRLAVEGKVGERKFALAWLLQLQGDEALDFLRERAAVEKTKGVVAELERLLQTGAVVEEALEEAPLEVPAAKSFETLVQISPEAAKDLEKTVKTFNAEAEELYRVKMGDGAQRGRKKPEKLGLVIRPDSVDSMVSSLRDGRGLLDGERVSDTFVCWWGQETLERNFRGFVDRHELGLVGRIRLLAILGFIRYDPGHLHRLWRERMEEPAIKWLTEYLAGPGQGLTLRDLGAAFEAAGLPASTLGNLYTSHLWNRPWNPLQLESDQIWSFFADRLDLLEEAFGLRQAPGVRDNWEDPENRRCAYRTLGTFPVLPPSFLPFLWEQALSGGKVERGLAWACLSVAPGRLERLVSALGDGKKQVRGTAADWLAEMGSEEAVDPLVKALKKEKMDEVKASIMEALEKCGAEIDRFLNRSKLQEEAEKGLAKGVPKGLQWFPFEGLPEVRWEKNRRKVPVEVLQWMLVQSFKTKNAEPGPLLRRYAALMDPAGRKALGLYVLKSWLSEDTRPAHTPEEAEALAQQDAQQMAGYAKANPKWYPNFSVEGYYKTSYRHHLEECMGSANPSKGILGVAGACGDAEMVPLAAAYVKKWFGRRMHQAKALLRMISWVDDGAAVQWVLSISTRFRTKGIQKEAGLVADEIAARKGWTRDEMADRTIPDGGFGEDGTQEIDYGTRVFVARLMDDFSIEIKREDGKLVKTLPNATKAEDEAEVKELKKSFSTAKRQIKEVVKQQKDRLYEAMCEGRRWRFEDWDRFLNRHTVVGRYCQRLVWVAERDGESLGCFRPLADHTLTDVADETLELKPTDTVKLAHRADLEEAVVEEWKEHLRDYEVEPLFVQLDTKVRTVDGKGKKVEEIKDYHGYLIGSFRLRGDAGKRGYVRGEAEDGGWFYTYHKRFEGLEIQATLEFTGNGIPEEDRTVALQTMYFTRISPDAGQSWNPPKIDLSELPPVLLSECWNDAEVIAARGEGFDKDWEKKSAY